MITNIEYFTLLDKNRELIDVSEYNKSEDIKSLLTKKVLRSSRGNYFVYSIINEVINTPLILTTTPNTKIFKIIFLGTQVRFQNFANFITYARETTQIEKKLGDNNEKELKKGDGISICPNYYDENILYDNLAETDFYLKYKQFLKDEKIFLLFK